MRTFASILPLLALFAASLPCPATAAARTSASFSVPAESLDAGGRRCASTAYSNDGSLGGIGGVSAVAAPAQTARHGYLGQLYEVTAFAVTASPATVTEGGARQLAATATLDDATFLAPAPTAVSWSVLAGPLTGINTGGIVTATNVFQNEPATVRGVFQGVSGTLGLTVLNVGLDDYGSYAGDGLDDAWQVRYFGLNSPNAAPGADPDGDGQDNFFEYITGTVPTDAASRFKLSIAPVPAQPSRKDLVFSPRYPTRTYTVQYRDNLNAGSFAPLLDTATADRGTERTVTDLSAPPTSRFYRVRITVP